MKKENKKDKTEKGPLIYVLILFLISLFILISDIYLLLK
jgi:hypothetical protein